MTYDPQKIGLICQATFNTVFTGADNAAQKEKLVAIAQEIGESGFSTVVLGQWHVHDDGSVYYNESQYYPKGTTPPPGALDFDWILSTIPSTLRQAGNVTKVMLEFGGWNCDDFVPMLENEVTFNATMQEIFDTYPDIDGLDFDPEGYNKDGGTIYSDDSANGIVAIAIWAGAQGKIVTGIPFEKQGWWTSKVLEPTIQERATAFSWWTLQGASETSYADWVGYVAPYIDNSGSFIVFGFNFDGSVESPDSVQTTLAQVVAANPDLDGAIIWRYENIANSDFTVGQFATALKNGLNGDAGAG